MAACYCLALYSALRASVALRATFRAPARIWIAVIDFQNGEQQSRSGSYNIKVTRSKLNCQRLQYEIHFVLCSCKIESSERKKIVRKHRYSSFEY